MAAYYRKRAPHYDEVYAFPAREADLATLRAWLAQRVAGRSVLEVAAGTGYWTLAASATARSVVATDLNPETLAIAAGKGLGPQVTLRQADAFDLPVLAEPAEVGMAHLWWSHVRLQDQARFLAHLASRLQPRGRLLMIDETFVRHVSTPISRRDAEGNAYQARILPDGALFEVVKNHPDEAALVASLEPACEAIETLWLPHFWAVGATFR
ncbi:MAG: class I SAM-dependent methyltransferase [Acetobacteraceae bacterium]|nr:class I SAM-dependent methyltransferase [Acetobacteraceae bacterium]